MKKTTMHEQYTALLKSELIRALGCTEPVAIAYAAAKAREVLGCLPEALEAVCSGSVIKNVHSVTVPNSGGLKGVEAAAILGALAGRAKRKLQVLEEVPPEVHEQVRKALAEGMCTCRLVEDVDNLYISITAKAGFDSATVIVSGEHTNIIKIIRNGTLLHEGKEPQKGKVIRVELCVRDILHYAQTVDLQEIRPLLEGAIADNCAIAAHGLSQAYGSNVGQTLLSVYGDKGVATRARAAAAAGSDARMNGCPMAVVINSGSGNQGITVTLPLVEYARTYHLPQERLLRGLCVSNLVALLQKRHIGKLSAYCGAVCAAAGAGAGIAYMLGHGEEVIAQTITYTLGTIGGMVCDGAKSSCAAKISAALEVALFGMEHAVKGQTGLCAGDGLVRADVDETIAAFGKMGKAGMRSTDVEILRQILRNPCEAG